MKNKVIVFLAAFFSSQFAFANCGAMPQRPILLNEVQVDIKQLEALESQFDLYLQSIDSYQACIDSEVTLLDTETENYLTNFEDKARLWDAAEEQKLLANDRYNMHIKTVDTTLPEEMNAQAE
ncbi:MAG: hypothetical protein ACJAYF_000690 [Arenicella sp.]|jgi:hypothetical protein